MEAMIDNKQYMLRRTTGFLLVTISLYLLCMTEIGTGFASASRFVILPLMIFAAYKNREDTIHIDNTTLLLFFLALIPSFLISNKKLFALSKAGPVFLMFFACSAFFSSRKCSGVQSLYLALLRIAKILILIDFIILVSGRGFLAGYYKGFWGNRNATGAAVVFCYCVLLGDYFKNKRKIVLAYLLACIVLVFYTQSRGALLSLALGTIAYFYFYFENKTRTITATLGIGIIIVAFRGFFSDTVVIRRLQTEGFDRGPLWEYGINVIKQNLAFGVGWGCSLFSNHIQGDYMYNFHNSYISIVADVGVFGAAIILYLLVRLFSKAINNLKKISSLDRESYSSLLALCFSFLGLSYGESYLIVAGSAFSFIFWACLFCLSEAEVTNV